MRPARCWSAGAARRGGRLAALHALVAEHAEDPPRWWSASSRPRPVVDSLAGAGYRVYGVNPLAVSRYRERHTRPGPSPTPPTPSSWPTWCAPTATTTGLWPGLRAGERDPGARPGPSGPDLDTPAPGERPALGPARLLPGRPGGLRHRPGLRRCPGHPRHRPDAAVARALSRARSRAPCAAAAGAQPGAARRARSRRPCGPSSPNSATAGRAPSVASAAPRGGAGRADPADRRARARAGRAF